MSCAPASPRLEMLVSTLGRAGIERLAARSLPRLDGLRWTVVWQCPQGELPAALQRDDMRVVGSPERGLSRSRNMALGLAEANLAAICDDDIDYRAADLERLIEAMERRPEALIAFRIDVAGSAIRYPQRECSLEKLAADYWLRSCEIALRPAALREAGIRFNENFGLGSPFFQSGEEDILRIDILRAGLGTAFLPIEIGSHCGESTTGMRRNSRYWQAKGAVTMYIHPRTWMLRLLRFGPAAWIHGCSGAFTALRRRVFSRACGVSVMNADRGTAG